MLPDMQVEVDEVEEAGELTSGSGQGKGNGSGRKPSRRQGRRQKRAIQSNKWSASGSQVIIPYVFDSSTRK